MYLPTSTQGKYSVRKGESGWAVFATQVTLNAVPIREPLTLDGAFGPRTDAAARELQSLLHVTVDGVLGPETGKALVKREAAFYEKGHTPTNLLLGLAVGESDCIVFETTPLYDSDESRDLGTYQDNTPASALANPTSLRVRQTFDVAYETVKARDILRGTYDRYIGQPGAKTPEEAWKLAVLHYNWQTAADALAAGRRFTWTYGGGLHLDDPAPWVQKYKIAGVVTGWDWCSHYILTKTNDPVTGKPWVTSWSV